jgi:parallel beta-helix repeat protein
MERKMVSGIMLTLFLLISMLTLAFNIQPVKASGTVYIRADGSIDPPTAPIQRNGDVYTFTNDIENSLVVQKDNIIVDGAGYGLQGSGSGTGLDLSNRNHVTIKNLEITRFTNGIWLSSSSYNIIYGNKIIDNGFEGFVTYGVAIWYSSNNNIVSENLMNHTSAYGIGVEYSSDNNTISGNTIINTAIRLYYSSNSRIYQNNFINNPQMNIVWGSAVWDDGYPSGGNYWSDYAGVDVKSGPSQNQPESDGIGDTPYVVDANNQDNYPLIHPYGSVRNLDTDLTYLTIQSAINAPETLDGHLISVGAGVYYENVVVNKMVSLFGENKDATIIDGRKKGIVIAVTSNNVMVTGFMTKNGTQAGIRLLGVTNGNIKDNVVISNDGDGIVLEFCTNGIASGNTVISNNRGIVVWGGYNNTVYGNTATDNGDGIRLQTDCTNISRNNITSNLGQGINMVGNLHTVKGNLISNNGLAGILLDSSNNVFSDNSILSNPIGVNVWPGTGPAYNNTFFHNNFVNNTVQVSMRYPSQIIWDDGYPSGGNYWSDYAGVDQKSGSYQNVTGSDGIGDTPYIIDANNTDNYPLMNPWTPPDIAVTDVASSKTVVGQGFSASINVTAANQGSYTEIFNVTLYANTTSIATQTITLTSGNSTTITFTWNTAGFAKGNYTIWAYAWPVLGETDTSDNRFTDGVVTVTILGDLDGNFAVQLVDLVILAKAYGSKPSESEWNPNADLDDNGIVGLPDLVALAKNYGQTYP